MFLKQYMLLPNDVSQLLLVHISPCPTSEVKAAPCATGIHIKPTNLASANFVPTMNSSIVWSSMVSVQLAIQGHFIA